MIAKIAISSLYVIGIVCLFCITTLNDSWVIAIGPFTVGCGVLFAILSSWEKRKEKRTTKENIL